MVVRGLRTPSRTQRLAARSSALSATATVRLEAHARVSLLVGDVPIGKNGSFRDFGILHGRGVGASGIDLTQHWGALKLCS